MEGCQTRDIFARAAGGDLAWAMELSLEDLFGPGQRRGGDGDNEFGHGFGFDAPAGGVGGGGGGGGGGGAGGAFAFEVPADVPGDDADGEDDEMWDEDEALDAPPGPGAAE